MRDMLIYYFRIYAKVNINFVFRPLMLTLSLNQSEENHCMTLVFNQRTDSPESRLEGNGLEVFIPFLSNLLKAFKIQNNLTIRQYYMQKYF